MAAEVRAARAEAAEDPEIDLLEIYERPRVRRDCEPCTVCQAVRDEEIPYTSSLPCGHTGDEVIWHSRPCIFVGCRPNLYLDVTENGSLKLTRPELEPEDMRASRSCVLDVASQGPLTLDEVGHSLDVSRERIRQLEVKALADLHARAESAGITADAINDIPDREQGYDHAADEVSIVKRSKSS